MELTRRDRCILDTVYRFKFCLGRHINLLAGFTGLRGTDRRLKTLIEAGYLARRKYLYAVPYLYTLTHKGRVLMGVNKREDKIRIEQIAHDIYVLDALIYFTRKYRLSLNDVESEKELHIKDGFGARKHHPDFVVNMVKQRIAVEIELNPKSKERLEKNIRDNYLNYDGQTWITNDNKVISLINSFAGEYANLNVIRLEEVIKYVRQ